MKRQYTYVKPHTVKACKEMAKVLINHDYEDNSLSEPSYYKYKVCCHLAVESFNDFVATYEFSADFEEWIRNYMTKKHLL